MGVEINNPCLDERALACNFTNEGGVQPTWRLSKNIMGLWLVQECKYAARSPWRLINPPEQKAGMQPTQNFFLS